MPDPKRIDLHDTGERMLPTAEGEISFVFARHRFAYDHIRQRVEGKTVIDVGCGTGYGCAILAEKAERVYGIDHDAAAIAFCRKNYSAANITYLRAEASKCELAPVFDVAVAFQVIEHMREVDAFLERLRNLVKPGGLIFLTTPNVKKPHKAKGNNPFHFSEMNYAEFRDLLGRHFRSFRIQGVAYASPNRLRSILAKTPFYRWGKVLRRTSRLKRTADRALKLSTFTIVDSNLEDRALDFLATCQNV